MKNQNPTKPARKKGRPRTLPPGAASFGSQALAAASLDGFAKSKSGLAYLSDRQDLSSILDPHAVVQFKNLLKRDRMTKARALEELISYAQAHPFESGGVEDGILDVWVHIFPHLSIDCERRVRELTQTMQFELMKSAKKRMERHIPKIVGPWLAGAYDRDRTVSRAASDCISSFLNTDEKTQMFWKKCKLQIIDYATEAMKETSKTLSDMRFTSEEDAASVFHRVLYSTMSLVYTLLQKLDATDRNELQDAFGRFFSVNRIVSNTVDKDNNVRRAAYDLIRTTLEIQPAFLETQIEQLAVTLTHDALKMSQQGSVNALIKLLTHLSTARPQSWQGKAHPLTQLRPLLEKGSQGDNSRSFWQELDTLITAMHAGCPETISLKEAANVLISFRSGISHRDELRSNAVNGWTAYLSTTKYLIGVVEPQAQAELVEKHVLPLLGHFVLLHDSKSVWISGAQVPIATRLSLLCCRPAYPAVVESSRAEWTKLSAEFTERMSNSLPEVSKEHVSSQQEIASEGDRWFSLVHDIHRSVEIAAPTSTGPPNLVEDVLLQPTLDILRSAVDLLKRRNYKPFGAAHVLSAAFTHAPHILRNEGREIVEKLFSVENTEELSLLLGSSSASQLLSCLRAMAGMPEFSERYKTVLFGVISILAASTNAETTAQQLTLLITNTSDSVSALNRSNDTIQTILKSLCLDTVRGKLSSWDLFNAVFASNSLSEATGKSLALAVTEILGNSEEEVANALTALNTIASNNPEFLPQEESFKLDLVTKLLAVTEINDPVLSSKVDLLRSQIDTHSKGEPPLVKIIQENLDSAGLDSLEIDTLAEQAAEVSKTATAEEKIALLPDTGIWRQEMQQFLQGGINPVLSLTNSLGGAYLLARGPSEPSDAKSIKRDQHGVSVPARMAEYTLKILQNADLVALPQQTAANILYLLYLVAEIGADQIVLATSDSFWGDLSDPWAAAVAEEAVADLRSRLVDIVSKNESNALGWGLAMKMLQETKEITPIAIYSARALSDLLQTRVDTHGFTTEEQDWISSLNLWKTSFSTALGAVAILTGYGELLAPSKEVSNFCNRLVSNLVGAKTNEESTMLTLVLLNACMPVYEVGELPVAKNRLVFTLSHVAAWFDTDDEDSGDEEFEEGYVKDKDDQDVLNPAFCAELCRALQRLVPCINDMAGPNWERYVRFCISLWTRAATDETDMKFPYIHASLKLMACLEAIPEHNDDLVEALEKHAADRWQAMIRLLSVSNGGAVQVQEIVNTLLCRMVSKAPLEHIGDTSELFGLVASKSREVQTAAFNILHRAVPAAQSELSFNAILDKTTAQLPEELLALLEDAPTLEEYPDDVLATFPTAVRGYLLAWRLVFDAFSTASAKVRGDYGDEVGKSGLLNGLIDFAFDVLGLTVSHAMNLDKAGLDATYIRGYDLEAAETETDERNMQWLLVHLYYESLRYLPGSCRMWFGACRSKQMTMTVDSWTAKYFSTLLTSDVLDDVVTWAETQQEGGTGADEKELQVKVNKTGREVVASYEVDDTEASLLVRLPPNYPISNVTVEGVNRVAATAKKWQSWTMIVQGVITFSNGNIVDGLLAFRRNLIGALKGQTECAICYSIVAEDKRMPDKRCATCKNLFHRFCLYRWMETSHNNTCPLCRTRMTLNRGHEEEARARRQANIRRIILE